jgi:hypothetical protein
VSLFSARVSDEMNTDVPKARAQPLSPVAERMRRYRKRRRLGLRSVRILLRVTTIDDMIRFGLLEESQRERPEALRAAVVHLIRQAMEARRHRASRYA